MQTMMQHYGNSQTNKTYVVKDLKRGVIERYVVMWEPEVGLGIPTPQPVSADARQRFTKNSEEFNYLDVINGVPYQSGLGYNAFDVRLVDALHHNVIADYQANAHWFRRYNDTMSSVFSGFSIAGMSIGLKGYTFEILLADNTKAILQLTGFKSGSFTPDYKIIKLVDSDNNVIPDINTNGKLTFRFTSISNFLLWLSYMEEAFGLNMNDFQIEWVKSEIPNGSIVVTDLPQEGEPETPNVPKEPEDEKEEE
jgi:hypothetical protein